MVNGRRMAAADHARTVVLWWLLLFRAAAVSVEVFLHKRFGQRYCRLNALAVFPLGCLYAWVWDFNGYDIRPLAKFYGAYAIALAISQVGVLLRLRRGDQEHSYYNGFPILLRASLAEREERVKLWFEPLLVIAIGVWLKPFSLPLGAYLIFAGCSLWITNSLMHLWQRRQVVDLQDAVFEQKQTAARFRDLQSDW